MIKITKDNLLRYITPLRIISIWFFIWTIIEYIDTSRMIENGHEPGLGGLGYLVLGFFTVISIGLDVFLSLFFKPLRNWIIQIMIIIFFTIAIMFL